MKKFITVFFAIGFLILATFSCKDDVTSSDEQQFNCVEDPHLVNIWDKCEIPYYVDASVPSQFVTKIQAAFDAWTIHTRITFKQKPESESNIRFKFEEVPGEDKCRSAVGMPYAVTFVPRQPDINPICSTHFNSRINWDNYDPLKGAEVNFQATATHEIGHSLGLKHIYNVNALMYCCDKRQTSIQ